MTGVLHIVVAMKPLDGNFAENALKHGVSGINVDGCRIGAFINTTPSGVDRRNSTLAKMGYRPNEYQMGTKQPEGHIGRWPANVILDDSEAIGAAFPVTTSGKMNPTHTDAKRTIFGQNAEGGFVTMETYGDSGSAARFFKQVGEYNEDME